MVKVWRGLAHMKSALSEASTRPYTLSQRFREGRPAGPKVGARAACIPLNETIKYSDNDCMKCDSSGLRDNGEPCPECRSEDLLIECLTDSGMGMNDIDRIDGFYGDSYDGNAFGYSSYDDWD